MIDFFEKNKHLHTQGSIDKGINKILLIGSKKEIRIGRRLIFLIRFEIKY